MARTSGDIARATTADLLARAGHDRDRDARTELVTRFQGLVRAVVASFRLQEADAADAIQNTWLRALPRLDTVRDPDRLGGWLATIARRECLALLSTAARETPTDLDDAVRAAPDPGPEAVVLGADSRRAVNRAVADLPARRRDLVHALFYGPPVSYAEIARATGLPIGSIGPTRLRTLRTLHTGLVQAGHTTSDVA
jgi:RNA polymerase sigma factor (sigma-70 family)